MTAFLRTLLLPSLIAAGGCDTADLLPLHAYVDAEVKPVPLRPWADSPANVEYPEFAVRAGIEGVMRLQLTVMDEGALEDLRVIEGIGGGCNEAAVEALRDERFSPGRVGGHPVNVTMRFKAPFSLADTRSLRWHWTSGRYSSAAKC